MNEAEKQKIIGELEDFYKELKSYKKLLNLKGRLSDKERLRETLIRKVGALKPKIIDLVGNREMVLFGTSYDIWSEAFNPVPYGPRQISALSFAIQIVNEAIGKLESTTITDLEAQKTVALPLQLFDAMQFHPKVVEASRKLLKDRHYRDATLRAFIEVNNFIKEKTGLELDGKALMAQVFTKENPVIKLNELRNKTEKDEQEGFMFLFMGAMVGIRNPQAHDNVIQTDPFRTLEYISLASLLMKRVEEGILVKTSPPRKKWNLQRFLVDTRERCKREVVDTIYKLYDFTKSHSDSISWGTGSYWGSFTFRKSGHGITASIFTVYSDSSLTINFGQMKGREIKEAALESLRVELNRIPEIKIPRDAVTIGKWPDISVEPLINAENLSKFQEAVLSLCKNIETGGDK